MMKKIGCILGVWLLVLVQVTAFAESAPAAVREASKSVVRVISETDSGTAFGTGFAIGETSPVSYIVTNYHVVDGAKRVSILLSRDNMIDAEVMTPLPASDIAILRLKSPINLNPIKLNDSEVKAGTGGYALGFPGDVDALSGAIDQEVKIRSGNIGSQNSIQIYENFQALSVYVLDVTISNGDSGGPFVNDKGEVVGINFAKSNRTDGIGVAIKISELTKVLDQNGIPYIKAQSMKIAWVALIVVGVIFVGAIAFLIIVLVKKHKKAKPVLYCVSGEFMGQRFYLDDNGVTIGRDPMVCQIVMPSDSPGISRAHCTVRYEKSQQGFYVTDLSSANGTYLANGTKLQPKVPTVLLNGARFYIGDRTAMFSVGLEK